MKQRELLSYIIINKTVMEMIGVLREEIGATQMQC